MSKKFLQILIPNAINMVFTYLGTNDNKIGDIVLVEFRKKQLWGVVISIENTLPENLTIEKIKPIIQIHPFLKLSEKQLRFIELVSSYNMANKGLVLKSFIGILNSDKIKKDFKPSTQLFDKNNFLLKDLLPDQKEIYQKISQQLIDSNTFLLDGVTGSGKTEIYFAIIADILKKDQNSQILILLPEIALTSQLLIRFNEQFGFLPFLWHSKISKKQKREIYFGIVDGGARVIIGARSSLLLPYKNLKLIIVDEEHDVSYKQEDVFNFNARDMSIVKSKIENFPVILSSATPSIETYYNSKIGKYREFVLSQKFGAKNDINIIDLRQEKLDRNNFISKKLKSEIEKNLQHKKQTLLFVNRRGYAPVTICKSCGKKYQCSNCDANLVLHKEKNSLICHYCGHQEKIVTKCKFCHEENSLINLGVGVERILKEINDNFPQAKTITITSDEITSFNDAEKAVQKILNNEVDIIIGTQMISKGYDFPNLNLIGIIDADSMLYSSDLRALEKSFQIFTQIIGRAGRREEKGLVIIQTYNPQNLIFEKIIEDNKNNFYQFELENRKIINLPPYAQMAKFEISSFFEEEAKSFAKKIISSFPMNDNIELYGPAPAPIQKLKNRHHFLIHLKVSKKINMQKLIGNVVDSIHVSNKVKLKIDINPL